MQPEVNSVRPALTFRNVKIVYYGPHECENCGRMICKAGVEFGGAPFNYPEGPIYPNTEWYAHICDPIDVKRKLRPSAVGILPDPEPPQGSQEALNTPHQEKSEPLSSAAIARRIFEKPYPQLNAVERKIVDDQLQKLANERGKAKQEK